MECIQKIWVKPYHLMSHEEWTFSLKNHREELVRRDIMNLDISNLSDPSSAYWSCPTWRKDARMLQRKVTFQIDTFALNIQAGCPGWKLDLDIEEFRDAIICTSGFLFQIFPEHYQWWRSAKIIFLKALETHTRKTIFLNDLCDCLLRVDESWFSDYQSPDDITTTEIFLKNCIRRTIEDNPHIPGLCPYIPSAQ